MHQGTTLREIQTFEDLSPSDCCIVSTKKLASVCVQLTRLSSRTLQIKWSCRTGVLDITSYILAKPVLHRKDAKINERLWANHSS